MWVGFVWSWDAAFRHELVQRPLNKSSILAMHLLVYQVDIRTLGYLGYSILKEL